MVVAGKLQWLQQTLDAKFLQPLVIDVAISGPVPRMTSFPPAMPKGYSPLLPIPPEPTSRSTRVLKSMFSTEAKAI
jgi:hypothetical protein